MECTMKLRKHIFAFVLLGLALQCHGADQQAKLKSYDHFKVVKIQTSNQNVLHELEAFDGLDFWKVSLMKGNIDVLVPPSLYPKLTSFLVQSNLTFSTMIQDVGKLINPKQKGKSKSGSKEVEQDDLYHSFEDIYKYLDLVEKTYPFVSIEDIGLTSEKRPMKVLKVCKDGCGHKPAIWIDGGIHAREWIAPVTVVLMIKALLENPLQRPNHSYLIDKLDWYFMPAMNPDGYVQSKNDRFWRKTRSCFDCPTGEKCTGVDANRNWGYKWKQGEPFEEGDTNDPCNDRYQTYRGPEPFSEIETRNVRDFILAHKDQIKFFNTLHGYGQFILLPWSYTTKEKPSTYDQIFDLAQKGNEALFNVHGTNYSIGTPNELIGYIASGVSFDWALGEAGIPYAMCLELAPHCEEDDYDCMMKGFMVPKERIVPNAEEVWAFHERVAELLITEFAP